MKNKTTPIFFLVLLFFCPSLSAFENEVRVIQERATIYSEPSKRSARIESIAKGAVLNLFQKTKVKGEWYYVSYYSTSLRSRVSGFIHESSVEPVGPELKPTPPPKSELIKPPPEEVRVQPVEKKAIKTELKAPPKIEQILGLTAAPVAKPIRLPPEGQQRQEDRWIPPAAPSLPPPPPIPKVVETIKTIKPVEELFLTLAPPPRPLAAPREIRLPQELVWKPPVPPVAEVKREVQEKMVIVLPKPAEAEPKPEKEEPQRPPTPQVVKPAPAEPVYRERPPTRGGLLTLGLGYGASSGGAGGFLQLNTKTGISIHGGVGVYPTKFVYSETDWVENEPLFSFGVKYYIPFNSSLFRPYIDIQYGGLRVEAAQIIIGIYEYNYVYANEQKSLWGPSALAGVEFRRGNLGINIGLGLSYNLTEWIVQTEDLSVAYDINLVFYF